MSVLDPVVHARLINSMDEVCMVANIPKAMLSQSVTGFLGPVEYAWLRDFKANRRTGVNLCMFGKIYSPSPETRMMAMAAAFLRNFVDARVRSLNALLGEENVTDDAIEASVLLIPNLYLRQGGKALPSWRMQQVYDLLVTRFTQSKPTVVYIEDLDALGTEYGPAFLAHLKDHYTFQQQQEVSK